MNIKYRLRDLEIQRLRDKILQHELLIHKSIMRVDYLRERIEYLQNDEKKHLKRDMEESLRKQAINGVSTGNGGKNGI